MEAFRAAIEKKDANAIGELLAEDVAFRSPIVFAPYSGKETVVSLLRLVARVFEDFHYVRELSNEDAGDHALVFKARIGARDLEGCDFLHVNDEGLIDEMFVMVRPLSAAHALRDAMAAQLEAA
jgi:hypothetical protein